MQREPMLKMGGRSVWITGCLCAFAVAARAYGQEFTAVEALRSALVAQQRALDHQAALIEQQRVAIAELNRELDALTASSIGAGRPAPGPDDASAGPSLKFVGYVQVDTLYFPGARFEEAEDLLLPRLINTDPGAPQRSRLRISARDTRLGLEARWPAAATQLRAYVEFDFFGQAPNGAQAQLNSYEPRLRHAYLEVGPGRGRWNVIVGQTWSALADPDAYGPFYNASPFGAVFVRQPQVRFTRWLNDDASVFLSIENPEGEVSGANGSIASQQFDPSPDVATGIRIERPWGHLQLAVLLRSISEAGPDNSMRGWGLALSGVLRPSFSPTDTLRFQVSGGEGMGRYLSDLGAGFDGTIQPDGAIHVSSTLAITTNYERVWSPRWRSAVGLSSVKVGERPGAPGGELRASRVITTNTVFRPLETLDLAAEITLGEMEDAGRRSARATLYRVTSRLSF